MSARKKLTLKMLGHVEEGYRLSETYANSRRHFKVITSDRIIGYTFIGDGYRSHVRVAPVYEAHIWDRSGKVPSVTRSYEVGEYLNRLEDGREDHAANAVALAILSGLRALTELYNQRNSMGSE